jgi:Gluconate 2-dehydrogenase subunit 3
VATSDARAHAHWRGSAAPGLEGSGLNRRDAVRQIVAGTVGAIATATWVDSLSAQARAEAHAHAAEAVMAAQDWTPRALTKAQNDAVVALTELIIPETDTPGAKAARVNRFIDNVLASAKPPDREKFLSGLAWMDERSLSLFKKDIASASTADQTALLTRLSEEGKQLPEDRAGIEFFQALKAMTISGYYTSEIGLRQELGDDGQLILAEFRGCDHPEHQ